MGRRWCEWSMWRARRRGKIRKREILSPLAALEGTNKIYIASSFRMFEFTDRNNKKERQMLAYCTFFMFLLFEWDESDDGAGGGCRYCNLRMLKVCQNYKRPEVATNNVHCRANCWRLLDKFRFFAHLEIYEWARYRFRSMKSVQKQMCHLMWSCNESHKLTLFTWKTALAWLHRRRFQMGEGGGSKVGNLVWFWIEISKVYNKLLWRHCVMRGTDNSVLGKLGSRLRLVEFQFSARARLGSGWLGLTSFRGLAISS